MDLNNTLAVWMQALSRSGEENFFEELNHEGANLATAVIWMVAASLVSFIVWALYIIVFDPVGQTLELMPEMLSNAGMTPEVVDEFMVQGQASMANTFYTTLILGLLAVPFVFLLLSGVLWIIARLWGGEGGYVEQTYVLAAFAAPLFILANLFNLVPLIGPFLILATTFYSIRLTFHALKAVHHITSGQAWGTLALPLSGLIFFFCCFTLVIASMMGAALG